MRLSTGAVLVTALIVAACGGGIDPQGVASLTEVAGEVTTTTLDGTSAPDDPLEASEMAVLDFAACMRGNGIEMDDPTIGADGALRMPPIEMTGTDPGEMEAALDQAMSACEEHLDGVIFGGAAAADRTDIEDRFVEFAACMRDHGYDVPDPDFSGSGGVVDLGVMDPDDPAFMAADEACRGILSDIGLGP